MPTLRTTASPFSTVATTALPSEAIPTEVARSSPVPPKCLTQFNEPVVESFMRYASVAPLCVTEELMADFVCPATSSEPSLANASALAVSSDTGDICLRKTSRPSASYLATKLSSPPPTAVDESFSDTLPAIATLPFASTATA